MERFSELDSRGTKFNSSSAADLAATLSKYQCALSIFSDNSNKSALLLCSAG